MPTCRSSPEPCAPPGQIPGKNCPPIQFPPIQNGPCADPAQVALFLRNGAGKAARNESRELRSGDTTSGSHLVHPGGSGDARTTPSLYTWRQPNGVRPDGSFGLGMGNGYIFQAPHPSGLGSSGSHLPQRRPCGARRATLASGACGLADRRTRVHPGSASGLPVEPFDHSRVDRAIQG